MMKPYENPKSGATHFEIQHDGDKIHAVRIRFKNGATYTYSVDSCGEEHVGELAMRAEYGEKLCRYISKKKPTYESKEMECEGS